ncbi:hypothetical protein RUND412_000395 [Rhizina undulata]
MGLPIFRSTSRSRTRTRPAGSSTRDRDSSSLSRVSKPGKDLRDGIRRAAAVMMNEPYYYRCRTHSRSGSPPPLLNRTETYYCESSDDEDDEFRASSMTHGYFISRPSTSSRSALPATDFLPSSIFPHEDEVYENGSSLAPAEEMDRDDDEYVRGNTSVEDLALELVWGDMDQEFLEELTGSSRAVSENDEGDATEDDGVVATAWGDYEEMREDEDERRERVDRWVRRPFDIDEDYD